MGYQYNLNIVPIIDFITMHGLRTIFTTDTNFIVTLTADSGLVVNFEFRY